MEPADLKSFPAPNDDAWLEAGLRRVPASLPDDGFSARVLAALPAPKPQRAPGWRILSCLVGAGAGCGFALWRGGAWPGLPSSAERFVPVLASAGTALADPWIGPALVATFLSLLVAFRTELRDRLMR